MKQATQIGLIAGANMAINFMFQWYVLNQLGAGQETDALFAAITIPQILIAIGNGALIQVLIPIFSSKDANRVHLEVYSLIGFIGLILAVLVILLSLTSYVLIKLIVPGFNEYGRNLTIHIFQIQLISVFFASINAIQIALCYARQKFIFTELTSIIASALSLFLLILFLPVYGVLVAAWCIPFRITLQFLFLTTQIGKFTLPDLKNPTIKLVWEKLKPLLFGASYYMTDPLIDRILLSNAASGNLSIFYFAQQIYGALSEIVNKTIGIPLISKLSMIYRNNDKKKFIQKYREMLWKVASFSLIIIIIMVIFGVFILYFYNDNKELSNSSSSFDLFILIMLLMIGRLIFGNIGIVITSMYYSIGNTKTPTKIGITSFTIGIALKVLMFKYGGVIGLAMAVSFSYVIYTIICIYYAKKELKLLKNKEG